MWVVYVCEFVFVTVFVMKIKYNFLKKLKILLHPAHTHTECRPAEWLWSAWSWADVELWEFWLPPQSTYPPSLSYCLLQDQTFSPPPFPFPRLPSPGQLPPCCSLCPFQAPPRQLLSSLPGQPETDTLIIIQSTLLICTCGRFSLDYRQFYHSRHQSV